MKYLVILVLVLLVAWQWRHSREERVKSKSAGAGLQKPMDMVACSHCGVHLPAQDAVPGKRGQYCDASHRATAEP